MLSFLEPALQVKVRDRRHPARALYVISPTPPDQDGRPDDRPGTTLLQFSELFPARLLR
jgi:hypothetical protein